MKITTSRLEIRPFAEEDLEDVFQIYRDEEVCRYLLHEPWTEANKEDKFKEKLQAKKLDNQKGLRLGCQLGDKLIGEISIWYTDMKETVEIGIGFNKNYSQMGYGKESMRGVLEYLFEIEKVHRVQANLDARNLASASLCESLGMRREAHFIQDYWSKGEWTDSYIYGMLKSDLGPSCEFK